MKKKAERVALFPGSFDPFTNGHLDLARRAAMLFDRVIVAVAHNPAKTSLFTPEERVGLIRESAGAGNITAMHFAGLVVDCARKVNAQVIIRGLRAVSDFEFEFQMALMNRRLSPGLEIAFLMPSQEYTYLNSTLVKEVAKHGGRVRGLVPPAVEKALLVKYGRRSPRRAGRRSS
jgi:pantetheine-phosphate adenylyltransferase